MITPEKLQQLKKERIDKFLQETKKEYTRLLSISNPDEDGWYEVKLPALEFYTDEEKALMKVAVESMLSNAGWEFTPTHCIFGYKIRPSVE